MRRAGERATKARRRVPLRLALAGVGAGAVAAAAAGPPAALAAADAGDIDSVVVFADRARVTRARAGRCAEGTARIEFDRLPALLDARTLRGEVRGEGRAQAEVIGVASSLVNTQGTEGSPTHDVATQHRRLESEIRRLETERAAVAAELETLGAYGEIFAATLGEEIRNPAPNTAAWTRTLDGLRARHAASAERRRKLEVTLRRLRLEQAVLARRLHAAAAGETRAYRTATLTIDCRGQSAVTGTISYVLGGAGWQPEYDVDFTPRGRGKVGPGVARLTVGATIRQSTGEDWRNVSVVLSTAQPKLGAEAPVPDALVVDGGEEKRGKVLVEAQDTRRQLAAGDAGGAAGPRGAALDDKGNAFVLTLPHRVTLPADGRPVWAPIDVVSAQAAAKLVATPKLDEHVYQVVSLKNPAAYPLLAGRVRSYRSGSFVGSSALTHRGVGEPLEISLGIDEELKIERQAVDEKDKGPGLLSSTQHIVRIFRAKMESRAAGPETIELRDNIPVSKIADVTVELLTKKTTSGYALDAARGLVTWTVPLAPGEKKNVDLGYAIHLPASWSVPGR